MPWTRNDDKDYSPQWRSRRQRLTQKQMDERGATLRRLREAEGWTQDDLRAHVRLSLSAMQNYEQGRGEGTRETWRQLARVFGVDAAVFLPKPTAPGRRRKTA